MSNDTDLYKGWSIDVSAMPHKAGASFLDATTDFIAAIFVTKQMDESFKDHQLPMARTFSSVGECLAAGHE